MTKTADPRDVSEKWLDSPLVKYAMEVAGETASPVDVAEIMLTMMHELEDLAPGVPFERLFAGVGAGAKAGDIRCAQNAMKAAGVSPEDIVAISGLQRILETTPAVEQRGYKHPDIVELAKQGMPVAELVELTGFGKRRIYRILQANGVERDQRRKGARPADLGYAREGVGQGPADATMPRGGQA